MIDLTLCFCQLHNFHNLSSEQVAMRSWLFIDLHDKNWIPYIWLHLNPHPSITSKIIIHHQSNNNRIREYHIKLSGKYQLTRLSWARNEINLVPVFNSQTCTLPFQSPVTTKFPRGLIAHENTWTLQSHPSISQSSPLKHSHNTTKIQLTSYSCCWYETICLRFSMSYTLAVVSFETEMQYRPSTVISTSRTYPKTPPNTNNKRKTKTKQEIRLIWTTQVQRKFGIWCGDWTNRTIVFVGGNLFSSVRISDSNILDVTMNHNITTTSTSPILNHHTSTKHHKSSHYHSNNNNNIDNNQLTVVE